MFKFFSSKTESTTRIPADDIVRARAEIAEAQEQVKLAQEEVRKAAERVKEQVRQAQTASAPAASTGTPTFRILVDGKVVYEGKSGSVDVQPTPRTFRGSTFDQVIVNGSIIGGSASPAIRVTIEGDVYGSVNAPMDVSCGVVHGNVDSGMSVTCGDVKGDVDAGMSVTCGNVGGDVDAGMNINVRR